MAITALKDIRINIRNILANLYDDPRRIRVVIDDSGFIATELVLTDPPEVIWHHVLLQAEKRNLIKSLSEITIKDFPNRNDLQHAWNEYVRSISIDTSPISATELPTNSKRLTNSCEENNIGADLAVKMSFHGVGTALGEERREAYKLAIFITSTNHISSENGAMRLTLAYPLTFGRSTADIFGSFPQETGLFDDDREENPHAQSLKVTWSSSKGNVIFPDDWYNFHGNAFSIEAPSLEITPNPTYLFRVELFTANRQSKKQFFFIQKLFAGEFNIGELDKQNQEGILHKFWSMYHAVRERTGQFQKR